MHFFEIFHMMNALSGIAMIVLSSLWRKSYLKRSFCC